LNLSTYESWPIQQFVTTKEISLIKNEFLNSIQEWSTIDPPNAALSISSLFQNGNSLDADLSMIPLIGDETKVIFGPKIRIVPYDKGSNQDKLQLSLLANIIQGISKTSNVLKLDMQVFSASLLTSK
jgi:hypothetical protein